MKGYKNRGEPRDKRDVIWVQQEKRRNPEEAEVYAFPGIYCFQRLTAQHGDSIMRGS